MASKYAGRSSKAYRQNRANLKAQRGPCYHCGQPIDYTLEWPDPGSFSADHIRPLSKYPELADDPGNLCASHLRCNMSKGAGEAKLSLGNRSEEF